MSHLGRWLSAQVDGELDGVERDRVLNHLAGCDSCRQEANALRALKRRMTALGDSQADTAIARRLIELSRSEPSLGAANLGRGWQPPHAGAGLRSRQFRPGWRIATGSAGTALAAIGAIAFMLGGGQAHRPVPKVTPAVDVYWVEHSYDTGQTPATGSILTHTSLPARYRPGMTGPGSAKMPVRPSSP